MAVLEGHSRPQAKAKEWSWSYSKLKNYEQCPRRHYEVDLAKSYVEEIKPDGPLEWGNRVHKALEDACKGVAPLPVEMAAYQNWVDRVLKGPGQLAIEQKFAMNRQFEPVGYFANDVWYRGRGDVVRVCDEYAMVLDWKTGKIGDDDAQLMLLAQCVFSHYPKVQYVRADFVWLKEDCTTPLRFTRREVAREWIGLMPRVNALEQAHVSQSYPPKPGRLCKSYCPVESCPFWKKGPQR